MTSSPESSGHSPLFRSLSAVSFLHDTKHIVSKGSINRIFFMAINFMVIHLICLSCHILAYTRQKYRKKTGGGKFFFSVLLEIMSGPQSEARPVETQNAVHRARNYGIIAAVGILKMPSGTLLRENHARWTPVHISTGRGIFWREALLHYDFNVGIVLSDIIHP